MRAFRNVMVPGAIVLALATCGGSLDMSPRPDHLVPWLRARDTPADVLGCQVVVRLLGEYRGKHGSIHTAGSGQPSSRQSVTSCDGGREEITPSSR